MGYCLSPDCFWNQLVVRMRSGHSGKIKVFMAAEDSGFCIWRRQEGKKRLKQPVKAASDAFSYSVYTAANDGLYLYQHKNIINSTDSSFKIFVSYTDDYIQLA